MRGTPVRMHQVVFNIVKYRKPNNADNLYFIIKGKKDIITQKIQFEKNILVRCLIRDRTRVFLLAKHPLNRLSYARLRTSRNYTTPDVCNWDWFGLKFENVYSEKFEKMSYRTYLHYKATLTSQSTFISVTYRTEMKVDCDVLQPIHLTSRIHVPSDI